jgi:hypothetical protein
MTENVYYVMSVKHELSISVGLNTFKAKGKMVLSRIRGIKVILGTKSS